MGAPSACLPVCGDGQIVGDEQCDDGNRLPGDGCSASCRTEPGWSCSAAGCTTVCGDGIKAGAEDCDDSNQIGGDGCSASCKVEPGFACRGAVLSFCMHSACAACTDQNCVVEEQVAFDTRQATPVQGHDANELTLAILRCAYNSGCEQEGRGFPLPDGGRPSTSTRGSQICLCGTAPDYGAACAAGTVTGPCYELMKLGADATSPIDVATRDEDSRYPLGRAVMLLNCQEDNCASVCP
jgi:cysteine-rich repeat protein